MFCGSFLDAEGSISVYFYEQNYWIAYFLIFSLISWTISCTIFPAVSEYFKYKKKVVEFQIKEREEILNDMRIKDSEKLQILNELLLLDSKTELILKLIGDPAKSSEFSSGNYIAHCANLIYCINPNNYSLHIVKSRYLDNREFLKTFKTIEELTEAENDLVETHKEYSEYLHQQIETLVL